MIVGIDQQTKKKAHTEIRTLDQLLDAFHEHCFEHSSFLYETDTLPTELYEHFDQIVGRSKQDLLSNNKCRNNLSPIGSKIMNWNQSRSSCKKKVDISSLIIITHELVSSQIVINKDHFHCSFKYWMQTCFDRSNLLRSEVHTSTEHRYSKWFSWTNSSEIQEVMGKYPQWVLSSTY